MEQADDPSVTLLVEKHAEYIRNLDKEKDTFEFVATEHLRMSGVYWGITAMALLDRLHEMDKEGILKFVKGCQHPSGGFGGNVGHDPHLLFTLSAVQILAIYDQLDTLDIDSVANYVSSLQQADGSFFGDEWGEVDTRFTYCAFSCLSLLGCLDRVDVTKGNGFVASCANFDGGFGATPGDESHAGQIFTAVGALHLGGGLSHVDRDLLGWWLCERQVKTGGLNGRPEKLPDVCYSWWVLSSLSMIDRLSWITGDKLKEFILSCQDPDNGGISDRPDDMADVFHTFFGIAGLSLLGYPGLKGIDPVYALPTETVRRLGLVK
mmetsp:Transcript_45106/g.75257  ORF Transcript_45106/g.75257 Transcript_45106/m.75257 type:complete len:321 (+) Transcript_45106:227-1189(+)|eukprot:CAMPEP_0198221674 /NCGR_PEP_ID=MMETSP1445-20131203/84681_1 /TAXON_ID=36898 /ORGANISM="Pyramimonas sp., Strain CCMP2087" /LENGTH=320 /DNA_ID=CAMNT_0043899899 /DNA_START=119 /DNA_END=1081 /DNA_ORIENTATION=+